MHLLVNALSIGSMSGQHVVYGFLRPMSKWMLPEHSITVLHYASEPPPKELLESGIRTVEVSDRFRNWVKRIAWEASRFPSVVRQCDADMVLSVSGALTPRCPVPQVVLCQNPWCYVPQAQYGWKERLKARLQRIGYRRAFRDAALMVYISGHLRDLYRRGNPRVKEAPWAIAYVGLNEETYQAARELRDVEREPLTILSVSAMAPWKGAQTLVEAVRILHDRGIAARLKLVGPWPNAEYEQQIRRQIELLQLQDAVHIFGRVSDDELHRLYATSRLFCLMSSCESYGIPAAEAMAFGTPVISTNCCAIAEICQPAGQFGPEGEPKWTADALNTALTNEAQWQAWSGSAKRRAATLAWDSCAEPFHQLPGLVGHSMSATQGVDTQLEWPPAESHTR